jgi:hypothetical protein
MDKGILCGRDGRRRGRLDHGSHGRSTVPAVALLTGDGAAVHVLLGPRDAGRARVALGVARQVHSRRALARRPGARVPHDAREALHLEAHAHPLAARVAAAVERAQVGVDGALVGLGVQLGCRDRHRCAINAISTRRVSTSG